MMALALNLLALLIVLGMCWGAMMWLSGRFHGQGRGHGHGHGDMHFELPEHRLINPSNEGAPERSAPKPAQEPCGTCEGVGAQNSQGKLAPCPQCYGTGVLS